MPDYLVPVSTMPVNDRPLEDLICDAIRGITGLPRNSVRPRIQPTPPNYPDQEQNWVAVGVNMTSQDTFAYEHQLPALEVGGQGQVERDEFFDVFCSFYGANSNEFMSRWREGLSVEQNRTELWLLGIKLVGLGRPQPVPSLLKDRYVRRIDFTAQFSRRVSVTYDVRTIAEVTNSAINTEELPPVPINVIPPTP